MDKEIRITSELSLPIDIITQTIAILAKRRAGKSYAARDMAEDILATNNQICVIDPKGDWWGIRSSADGKRHGYPVTIFGGEHGDVPLLPGTGEIIARLVAEDRVSCVLDLSMFRKHELATFMTAFMESLYQLKAKESFRTPMMLIIDEADAIAPQKPAPNEARMLGAADDIVRRGGQRGLGCMLISQRSAVLNKNVLTQSEILITLRTIAPQDIDAMEAWFQKHGTKEQRDVLVNSLPSLPIGDAWFWSPGWPSDSGIFKRVHMRPIRTFDSGATPKAGEVRVTPKVMSDVDLEVIRKQMADVIAKVKADDPKELRAEIARLKSELYTSTKDYEKELMRLRKELQRDIAKHFNPILKHVTSFCEKVPALMPADQDWDLQAAMDEPLVHVAARALSPAAALRVIIPSGNGASGIRGIARKILTVLAQYPDGMELSRLAILCGSTVNGHLNNTIGNLRTSGYITPARVSPIQILQTGVDALGAFEPLPRGAGLRQYWLNRLGGIQSKILATLFSHYPEHLSLEGLASASGSTVNGHFNNSIGSLRTMGLMTPARTPIKAVDYLFEE